ncbi:MAG: desulfoferrodoxin family protein [Methylobacter sp.]
MERRDFIRLSAVGAGLAVAPALALAEEAQQASASRDIYYTKDAPGRWQGKVATHLPTIEVSKTGDAATIKVVTAHEMKGYEHYIVKHVLLDKNYKFLDEHLFDPTKESVPVSTFTLKKYSGTIYALSMCNKHDLWLNSATV